MKEKRIFLRALELDDYKRIHNWRNDRSVTNQLGGNTFFVSTYREMEWVKNAIMNDSKDIRLAICLKSGEFIGMVNLTSIDLKNRKAEFSILIGEKEHWGKGLGFEATYLSLKYAFEELNLHRIYLFVKYDNLSAIKLYTKIGFFEEGLLRDEIFKNNHYISMKVMAILKNEFLIQKLG